MGSANVLTFCCLVSSIATEVSQNISTKELKMHNNNDVDNEHDNLTYDFVHVLPRDATSQEKIPLENDANNINIDGGT